MLVHLFQIILNFLYVCQSLSWPTSLLKLYKYRIISSSGRDIFLKFFGDIPGMLVHYFQIILNLMFFCQSVCLLTSLPKLDKGIYPDLDDVSFWIFLRHSWTLVHLSQIILNFLYICQPGSWHTSLMKSDKYRNISSSE